MQGRGGASEEPSNDAIQQNALRTFNAPDAIMEPGIFEVLRRYIAAGGTPPEAVQALAQSYRGYAQLDNLLCKWLRDVALAHIRSVISQKFDARRVDAVFEEAGGVLTLLFATNRSRIARERRSVG